MSNSFDDFIIPPVDQDGYFNNGLFYQYLGTKSGAKQIRAFISGAYTDSLNGIEYVYQSILDAFCIDSAAGTQLDLIGTLVGLPRMTLADIGQAGFFGFDGSPNLSFDYGFFQDGKELVNASVSDDQYRLFLKVKIAANVWDGTRVGLKKILQIAFDADKIEVANIENTETGEPFVLDSDNELQGFDSGQFDVGIGFCQPAVFEIILTGDNITDDDVDAITLLDLIPTPQGVRLESVTIGSD